jgi:DNA-directed RNA polymerase subunit M/transcription elongation factor TFIIS
MDLENVTQRTETIRAKACHRLRNAVDGDDVLATKIEKCIWNSTLRTFMPAQRYWDNHMVRYKYTTKVLSIEFNLKNPKNPGLFERIKAGEVSSVELVKMTPYQMFPEMWDPIFERVAHKQLRKQLTTDVANAPDGAFTCARCKSKKTTYYQLQTRSADGMCNVFYVIFYTPTMKLAHHTIFFTCRAHDVFYSVSQLQQALETIMRTR